MSAVQHSFIPWVKSALLRALPPTTNWGERYGLQTPVPDDALLWGAPFRAPPAG